MATDDESIDIKAEFHNEISAPAEAAAQSIDDLGDEALGAAAKVEVLGVSASGTADDIDDLGDAADRARGRVRKFGDDSDKTRRDTDRTTKSVNDMSGAFSGLFAILKPNIGGLFSGLKIYAAVSAVGQLSSALSALGAAGLGAVNGLAPLTGLLAAYPAMIGAGVTAMAAFKLGISGVSDALSKMVDPMATAEEKAAAMGELSPEAAKAVTVLAGLNEVWKQLKKNVQEQLFMGLAPIIKSLASKYLPVLNKGLQKMAWVLNGIAKYTAGWLGSPETVALIGRLFNQFAYIVERVGKGLSIMFHVMLQIIDIARPMTQGLARDFLNIAEILQNKVNANAESLRDFFIQARVVLHKVVKFLADVTVGFYNIVKNAGKIASMQGNGLLKMAAHFREWTESAKGQTAIKAWFEEMVPVLKEFTKLGGAIWEAFKLIFSPQGRDSEGLISTLKLVRKELLPAITQTIQNSKGNGFMETLVRMATVLVRMWDAGLLGNTVPILNALAGVMERMMDIFDQLPDPVKKVITSFIMFGAIFKLSGGLGFLLGGKGGLVSALVNLGRTVLPWIARGIMGLFGPVGIIIGAIAALVAAFWWLYNNSQPFRAFVDSIIDKVREWWTKTVQPFMQRVVQWWNEYLLPILKKIGEIFMWYVENIWLPYMKILFAIIFKIFEGIGWFISEILWPALQFTGQIIAGLYNAVRPIWDFFWGMFEGIANNWSSWMSTIQGWIKTFVDAIMWLIQPLIDAFNVLGGTGMAIWNAVTGNDTPEARFLGGPVITGQSYLVGEQGPEAFVGNGGVIKMVGMDGPEFLRASSSGQIIPHGATVNPYSGHTGNASQSAVTKYRQAVSGGRGAAMALESPFSPQLTLNVYPRNEVDVERAVLQAMRQLERERRERS